MVFNRLASGCCIGVAEVPQSIAHDEHIGDAFVAGAPAKFREINGVFCLVLKELVHVLDGINAELLLCRSRKVEVVESASEERVME